MNDVGRQGRERRIEALGQHRLHAVLRPAAASWPARSVSRNGPVSGTKKPRGCGSKVKATTGAPKRCGLLARRRASSAWWPRCTPSKLPSATTPPFQSGGTERQSSNTGIMRCQAQAASRRGTSTTASPSITTLSPFRHWVLSVTRRRFSSMAVMVATAVMVSPISTGAMKFMVWEI